MSCHSCYFYTGIKADHSRETCPVIPTLHCRRCHCYGHTANECGESWAHWERPTSLEELIPVDVRERWNITTSTDLVFDAPRGTEGTECEHPIEIKIVEQDKAVRDFMMKNNIDTTRKTEQNLQRIREWAAQRGFRLVFDRA
jgi:hypothetical protein